ncbi:20791_t:CDS:2 [Dentiscutata erythropus]|uniref:20791_t:CDS:1 n=1 Tax=Dentiscutata erythropus TaxID=1348616 RepID=A0A9N9IKE5_9GLOM|nr:20791_t:CDS:2 [Dentiscutata erythropus]
MDNYFNQLEQVNWNNAISQPAENQSAGNDQAPNISPITVSSVIEAKEDPPQGNYPPTPILNCKFENITLPGELGTPGIFATKPDSNSQEI